MTPWTGSNSIPGYATSWRDSTLCSVPDRNVCNLAGSCPSGHGTPARRPGPTPPRVSAPRSHTRLQRFRPRSARGRRRPRARPCFGNLLVLSLGNAQGAERCAGYACCHRRCMRRPGAQVGPGTLSREQSASATAFDRTEPARTTRLSTLSLACQSGMHPWKSKLNQ